MRLKMKDMIREAFNSSKNLNSKWDSQSQVNAYSLDIFLRKAGYKLVDIIPQDKEGKVVPELIIEPVKAGYRHPEITHMVDEGAFYMKMKSYGEMPASDVETIIEVYQNVLAVLNHLNGLDTSKLEYEKPDYDKPDDSEE